MLCAYALRGTDVAYGARGGDLHRGRLQEAGVLNLLDALYQASAMRLGHVRY